MDKLPTVGYAALADAVYDDSRTQWGGFARQLLWRNESDGFHASLFMRTAGGKREYVLSYAGTELGSIKSGNPDVAADAGFGGGSNVFLLLQKMRALVFAEHAQKTAKNASLTLCGHSLGGGLAQIVASDTGLPAVTFSAPAVTAVDGVAKAYAKNKPKVVSIIVKNDPVNMSVLKGKWLGTIVVLASPRTGLAAHYMDDTLAELVPHGQFAATGAKDPFTLLSGTVTS
jgi:hypothetical protein